MRYSRRVLLTDTQTPVSWRARPRSFVALMGLYESNFIRFGWLAGKLTALAGRYRSAVRGDCDLVLTVTERSPYTSTVNLTYLLPHMHGSLPYPDMQVRIYGDTAVVTGGLTEKGTRNGTAYTDTYRWTDVFVKRGSRWQAVVSQWAKVP